jgi:subtilisin family serine protease
MRNLFYLLLFISSFYSYSQEDAWVYFNDKPDAQTYLDNPLTMLTQRALDRRTAQNIPLNSNDTPIYQPYIDQITAANGITVKAKSKWMNCLHVRGMLADIQALTSFTFVNHIHYANSSLNNRNTIPKPIIPVNKQLDVQSNFNYGNSTNQIQMLNGQILHQQNYTGQGKIIAVLDSGFINVNSTAPFQRLFNNNLILGGYNYVNQSNDVYSLHNHGTATLSCMGGFVDGQLVGTAPDANYYLFVTEDVTSENPVEESYWVEAAEEADRLGVDIISTSLGYYEFDNSNYSHTYDEFTGNIAFASQGANIAFSKGMIVVASAGNSAGSPDPYNHIGVPAEATNVLAVGAVKSDETYATFSSIGPSFDGRIKPDVMAQGQQTTIANTAGNITSASGTSFSCPIMAGAIASFWSAFPTFSNQEILNFVKQSADRYSNPDNQYGYGIPDFQVALNMALLSNNQNNEIPFQYFPNPTNSELNFVGLTHALGNEVNFYNGLGQLVLTKKIDNSVEKISLESLSNGIYYFTIPSSDKIYQGKIIKK